MNELTFFIEVTLSGLMAGVMYSLVALGFVLIFKASGVFNFAQGVMALFAALTLVGFMDKFGIYEKYHDTPHKNSSWLQY